MVSCESIELCNMRCVAASLRHHVLSDRLGQTYFSRALGVSMRVASFDGANSPCKKCGSPIGIHGEFGRHLHMSLLVGVMY